MYLGKWFSDKELVSSFESTGVLDLQRAKEEITNIPTCTYSWRPKFKNLGRRRRRRRRRRRWRRLGRYYSTISCMMMTIIIVMMMITIILNYRKRPVSQATRLVLVVPAYSYFEKGCRKRCTRQSQKVLWVGLSSLFFKEIWKNGRRGHGSMFASAKGKQQK